MATHAHSTTAPSPQRALLRALAGSLPMPAPAFDLFPRSGEKPLLKSEDTPARTGVVPPHGTLATVETGFHESTAQPWPGMISVQSDPKADVPNDGGCCDIETPSGRHGRACHDIMTHDADRGHMPTDDVPHDAARGPIAPIAGPLPSLGGRTHTCTVNRADIGTPSAAEAVALKSEALSAEPGTSAQARALHARRELHQALDFGFALLDAFDLPPLALDVIDDAIAHLDALDAPREDLEDDGSSEHSLGSPENHPGRWHIDMACRYHASSRHHPLGDQTHWGTGAGGDVEDDGDDREPEAGYDLPEGDDERCASGDVDQEYSCGWTAKVDQVHLGHAQDEQEEAALERHGRGFVRSGPEDAEDDELGDEHAPEIMEWMFGLKRNAEADRQSFTAWLAAAEVSHV